MMGLTFNDFNKRSIRIINNFHKFYFKCDSVRIFSFFIMGGSKFLTYLHSCTCTVHVRVGVFSKFFK